MNLLGMLMLLHENIGDELRSMALYALSHLKFKIIGKFWMNKY